MAKQTVVLNARSGWLLPAMYSFNDPAENAGFLLEMKGLSTNETIRDSSSRNNAKSFVFLNLATKLWMVGVLMSTAEKLLV